MANILEIRNLSVEAYEAGRPQKIIDNVSLDVVENGVTALVGGSGCGKTTTALAVMRLLGPGLKISSGEVLLAQSNVLGLSGDALRRIRGGVVSMVFQEPLDAFNPVFTIGYQIDEMIRFHTDLSVHQRKEKLLHLLDQVGLEDPALAAGSYPHQLSGGMRQRAMIAQAIAAGPRLIIADEPTSNLDVTLQAKIIELFLRLKEELKLSVMLITHDLGMVEHIADDVVVMSAGAVVEAKPCAALITKPEHEYTKKLLGAFRN
jgi:ABC-type dipeptide/oligopeptide/nickel transport system ATPase component